MTTVSSIYDFIDSFAPFSSAESWDNVGVLVGDKKSPVTKVLLSLDITNGVVEEAHDIGADLIVSHHPIIFGGLKKLSSDSPVYRAAKYDISCLCAHTNLDKSPVFGVNTALAAAIGLVDCRPCENNEILFTANTTEITDPGSLAFTIKKKLRMGAVPFTEYNMEIKKVGLCSGAGGSEIFSAIAEGCDAFVTGEIKHHELLAANEAGLSTFILGHYHSEDVVITPLAHKLSEVFPDISFEKSKTFGDGVGILV